MNRQNRFIGMGAIVAALIFTTVAAMGTHGIAYARHHGFGGPGLIGGPDININFPKHGESHTYAEAHSGDTGGHLESHTWWGDNSGGGSGGGSSDNSGGGGSGGSDNGGGGGGDEGGGSGGGGDEGGGSGGGGGGDEGGGSGGGGY